MLFRSWRVGAGNVFDYEEREGRVRYRPSRLERIVAALERNPALAGSATAVVCWALVLWSVTSLGMAIWFLLFEALLCVRRAHFVDLGRFTIGVWPASGAVPPLLFGIAWAYYGKPRKSKRCGLQIIVGNISVGVLSFMPRAEWAKYKRSRAAAQARKEAGR